MDNSKQKPEKKQSHSVNITYDESQTIPLALHEMHMARADRRLLCVCVCWAVSVIIIVCGFIWLWNQYDYESTTELSGVYNLVDSQGNVVSSDLAPDDVIRILEELNNGNGQENQDP